MAQDDELRDDTTEQFNEDNRVEETRRNTDMNPEDVREKTDTSQREEKDESDHHAGDY